MLQLLIMPQATDRGALSWSAYEHEHTERSGDWFLALSITTVSIAIIAILIGDLLFAILIVIAAFTIALLARTPPTLTQFSITDRGLHVGEQLHRYDELVSFWVEENHHSGRPLLLIDTTKFTAPNIIIPLESVEAEDVRTLLLEHIQETPMKEPLSHRIFEFLGF